jgi:hypothetical protein
MRCPACNVENAPDATRCSGCQKSLARRPRRRNASESADGPVDPEAERRNAAAMRAYRMCMLALIPGLGLVLGPVALAMAGIARARGKRVAGFNHLGLSMAVMILAALITATQWAGVTLVWLGLSCKS